MQKVQVAFGMINQTQGDRALPTSVVRPPAWLRWLMTPVAALHRHHPVVVLCATIVGSSTAAVSALRLQPFFSISDAQQYLDLAAGNERAVMQPFASRQLGALVAHWLSQALHLSLQHGFELEATLSLLLCMGIVTWLCLRCEAPRWLLVAVVLVPFWTTLVQNLVFPDLLYAALLAVVLLLLTQRRMMLVACMMLPLMLARESTSLILACLLLSCWQALQWRHRIVAVAAAIIGGVWVSRLAQHAQPNPEKLPAALYLLAKLPWNFMRNVLGVLPWSNVDSDLCRVPAWKIDVALGPVHAIGICGVSFESQRIAVAVLLTNFGLLPLLLARLWWPQRRAAWRLGSPLLRFTLLYGAACLLLSPLIGAGFLHLVGYAWPLFLVAVPLLYLQRTSAEPVRPAWSIATLLALHLAICATAYHVASTMSVTTALFAWAAAIPLLRWRKHAPVSST